MHTDAQSGWPCGPGGVLLAAPAVFWGLFGGLWCCSLFAVHGSVSCGSHRCTTLLSQEQQMEDAITLTGHQCDSMSFVWNSAEGQSVDGCKSRRHFGSSRTHFES